MGQSKLLLPLGQTTVIQHVLHAWRAGPVFRTVVVVHPDDAALAQACRRACAEVVVPSTAPPDMKASIQCGLNYVREQFQPGSGDVWLLAPADLPLLSDSVIAQVLAAHNPDSPRIIAPLVEGRRGHPVLFPWPLAAEVSRLEASQGVNCLLQSREVLELAISDSSSQQDLDTPEDYQQLWQQYGRPT